MAESIARAVDLEDQLKTLRTSSDLPEHPDYGWANTWLIGAYQREWLHTLGRR